MKDSITRMRVDSRQKKWWHESMDKLGIPRGERSSYYRSAVDRAIAQDFRSNDKKWQKFIASIQALAVKHLGYGISDNFEDRTESLKAVWKASRVK